ncbi:aspartate carbamoyltransferase regulatory subunit [Candidatus Woesearchaeota archaeon]|nr:aspartate carbamoyltransferase regulatory subunit [Candidatus Woesearchaeota archaeon]
MKKEMSISAIREGTAIDHIPSKDAFNVAKILNLKNVKGTISVATNLSSKGMKKKGIIKIGNKSLTQEEVNKIAILAPNATVNIIRDYTVKKKMKVALPNVIKKAIKCSNPNCITNKEDAETVFSVLNKTPLKVKCHYCERLMGREDITLL